mmetsp:Transcript_81651/g.134955  ORF Transcript_81651/g.134955 Transcript_81651/m.134955 type:complete len:609 (-) Transcript_81651:63-1889(-)
MSCCHGSCHAKARSCSGRDDATRATVNSELKKVGGVSVFVCNKCDRRGASRPGSPATSRPGSPVKKKRDAARSGHASPSPAASPPPQARPHTCRSRPQSPRGCKHVNKTCCQAAAPRKGVVRAWAGSAAVATAQDSAVTEPRRNRRPRSLSLPPAENAEEEAHTARKDTPRTLVDASLLKSQILLQQLEQLGLLEDVGHGQAAESTSASKQCDLPTPISDLSTSASLSDCQASFDSSFSDKGEKMDIVPVPVQSLEMLLGMWQELQRLRTKEESSAAGEKMPEKVDMVSIPSELLDMLVEMWQEMKHHLSKEDKENHAVAEHIGVLDKSVASVASQATTADATTADGNTTADEALSLVDSMEANVSTSTSTSSSPRRIRRAWSRPAPVLCDFAGAADRAADLRNTTVNLPPQPPRKTCESVPGPFGPPRHIIRMSTMPPAPASARQLSSPPKATVRTDSPCAEEPCWKFPTACPSRQSSTTASFPSRQSSTALQNAAWSSRASPVIPSFAPLKRSYNDRLLSPRSDFPKLAVATTPAMCSPRSSPASRSPSPAVSPRADVNTVVSAGMLRPTPRVRPSTTRLNPRAQQGPSCLVTRTVTITDTFIAGL